MSYNKFKVKLGKDLKKFQDYRENFVDPVKDINTNLTTTLLPDLNDKIDQNKSELDANLAAANTKADNINTSLTTKLNETNSTIASNKLSLDSSISTAKSELNASINQISTDLDGKYKDMTNDRNKWKNYCDNTINGINVNINVNGIITKFQFTKPYPERTYKIGLSDLNDSNSYGSFKNSRSNTIAGTDPTTVSSTFNSSNFKVKSISVKTTESSDTILNRLKTILPNNCLLAKGETLIQNTVVLFLFKDVPKYTSTVDILFGPYIVNGYMHWSYGAQHSPSSPYLLRSIPGIPYMCDSISIVTTTDNANGTGVSTNLNTNCTVTLNGSQKFTGYVKGTSIGRIEFPIQFSTKFLGVLNYSYNNSDNIMFININDSGINLRNGRYTTTIAEQSYVQVYDNLYNSADANNRTTLTVTGYDSGGSQHENATVYYYKDSKYVGIDVRLNSL